MRFQPAFWISLGLSLALAGGVQAQSFSTKANGARGLSKIHSKLLDGKLARQYGRPSAFSDDTADKFARNFDTGPYRDAARAAAQKHGIPEDLFVRLVKQESGFNPTAVSHKGAIGLAQLMPMTARALGVDPHDPNENLEGGARYLRTQFLRFRDWKLALAAYNAGPEAVEKYGGIPPYAETKNYVASIMAK
ncbi:lytic transglycosylase domain-containing protein [Oceanomicrobium pacificus]|uniref:Transglycosylase SLT domain-containing protein n=1 Tax=Oceanomicrobium pacificus TaxID=2692916 RepID=A0A6B0TPP2_9RHOB|nr:lytic transglycosylase domain-containing protein [Oceanomicrobium pacificus]MXU65886.1 transglycosylase SLT domain-containing protein [Oceanomicrobium pacificus]